VTAGYEGSAADFGNNRVVRLNLHLTYNTPADNTVTSPLMPCPHMVL
jgi:hypothetical protein